jgi:hypothetical protein
VFAVNDNFDDIKLELPEDFFDMAPKQPAPSLTYYELWENDNTITLITTDNRNALSQLVENQRMTAGFGAKDADDARNFVITVKGIP